LGIGQDRRVERGDLALRLRRLGGRELGTGRGRGRFLRTVCRGIGGSP